MFLSSDNICQRLLNSTTPILFIDTCIFLDILRSPCRDNISINEISSALNLIKLSKSTPPKVWLLTNEMVRNEWEDNITQVKNDLKREIKKRDIIQEKLVTAANIILDVNHPHNQKMTSLNLQAHLENLSSSLLNHCLIIKCEDNHSIKAMQRVIKNIAPAKRGKSEPKDCQIFEAFLDISEKVQSIGRNRKIYFLSSNSTDYGKPNNPFIQEDLKTVNAELINGLEWAVNISKL